MEHPLGFGSFNSPSARRPNAGYEKKTKGGGLNFSADLLAILPKVPKLESINFSNLKREFVRGSISLQKFAEILRNCENLKSLNLNGSDFFKVPLMIETGEILLRLTRLEFSDHFATPATFLRLAAFRNLESLNVAKGSPESGFGYPSGVNETLLQIFGQNLRRLKRLNLGFIKV